MEKLDFGSLWEQAWEAVDEFCEGDHSLQRELRINGTMIPRDDKKAYKTVAAAWVASKLQEGVQIAIGYADAPWDRVFLKGGQAVQA